MGHDLPRPLWPRLIELISDHAHAADREREREREGEIEAEPEPAPSEGG